jgi:transaldolase
MSEKKQPSTPQPKKQRKPAPHEHPQSREIQRHEATAPQKYLGGTVQSMAGEEQARTQVTTREASAQLLAAIKTARELGAVIEGNVVRIPMLHTGVSAIDWLSKNGYRIVGT